MLFKSFLLVFGVMLSVGLQSLAQSNPFTGTFVNASQTIMVQFKPAGAEYHGLLQVEGGSYAIKATVKGAQMKGTVYTLNGPAEFTASAQNNSLMVNALGYTEQFFMMSPTHNLAGVDLRPYMVDARAGTPSAANSPYAPLQDPELFRLIAGSQVVYYTRTSYVNDNVASSLTYVNFCANGAFSINYDGSFMVEGYGGNAQGATYGQNAGTWQLVSHNGQAAVYMVFRDGSNSLNPVNKNLILQGRWQVGNTQYAIQRNKIRCP